MCAVVIGSGHKIYDFLPANFNKKKYIINYNVPQNDLLAEMQNMAKHQCLNNTYWPQIDKVKAWMISAETATFMKCGGLGMVASELPENFNTVFGKDGHNISIITPMYLGDTGKKKAELLDGVYYGAEGKSVAVKMVKTLKLMFAGKQKLRQFTAEIYHGIFNGVDYYFIRNDWFFGINPAENNPSGQTGCYVLNEKNVDEVERFAFFSKVVYQMLENAAQSKDSAALLPNILIANDWHSGALSGLTKYWTLAKVYTKKMSRETADKIKNIPIIHIAHHMGYQGWDYNNTSRILNALYEDLATLVLKNAKAIKNSNPRTQNTIMVSDTYNQASGNMHLADRIITVSKNYMEEVSSDKNFGFDFRDILKIRKNYRTFFGIVNGYEKRLISPNEKKIKEINDFFKITDFKFYDENSLNVKRHNKRECLKLLSRLATDEKYKEQTIPLVDLYKFDDVVPLIAEADNIPIICMTSRMVEQKGYDMAIHAILHIIDRYKNTPDNFPIFILGGAGNKDLYSDLMMLKDNAKQMFRDFAKRIFVFRGYKDEFAYSVQLAADFYMMPSYFEPCGLTQMEAMAKGALPIATSTGGLVDTIADGVDGFRTEAFFAGGEKIYGSNVAAQNLQNNLNAYEAVLDKAIRCFHTAPEMMRQMQRHAMKDDFSWSCADGSVYKYYNLFKTGRI